VTLIAWLARGRRDRPQPVAAIAAMKPSLQQTTLTGLQRIAGALIGAAAAVLLLLIPASEHGLRLLSVTIGLEVVAIVLIMHAVAIRLWNYALYAAAIAAAVLIPSCGSAETASLVQRGGQR
jgi:uncharacterized membrane protein YgaE (UPF0421/DUF939 family)